MVLPGLEIVEPEDVRSALKVLHEPGASALAGGTDIIVNIKSGLEHPGTLVSLANIRELSRIEHVDGSLKIGSCVTISRIAADTRIPALAAAASVLGSPQVRTLATIGGNIASAVPCADMPPILIALSATAAIESVFGTRTIPLKDIFIGPRKTILKPGELLTHLTVPMPRGKATYIKFGLRESNAIAVAAVAAYVEMDKGTVKTARVVLGAVYPIPFLAPEVSAFLVGKEIDARTAEKAGEIAANESKPITDIRGSDWYRRKLVAVLTRRALIETGK